MMDFIAMMISVVIITIALFFMAPVFAIGFIVIGTLLSIVLCTTGDTNDNRGRKKEKS